MKAEVEILLGHTFQKLISVLFEKNNRAFEGKGPTSQKYVSHRVATSNSVSFG